MKVLPTMDTSNTTGTKPTSAAAVSPDLTNHGFLPVNPKKAATPAKPPAKPTAQSGASSKNRFDALPRPQPNELEDERLWKPSNFPTQSQVTFSNPNQIIHKKMQAWRAMQPFSLFSRPGPTPLTRLGCTQGTRPEALYPSKSP